MRIDSAEFRAMAERVVRVTGLTSRLNVLPFDDEAGRAALLEQILGRPVPARTTIYPPFYTDHGLRLDLAERVFVNQGCTFLDYAGIRLGERVMIGPKATFITGGHPVDPAERRLYLTGAPIDVAADELVHRSPRTGESTMTGPQSWVAPTCAGLADLLAGTDAWDSPSLCEKWLVRHVVAHLTMPARLTPAQYGAELAAARGAWFGVDLTGVRLEATDTGWSWGDGRPVRADSGSLLSLASGRTLPDGRTLPRL